MNKNDLKRKWNSKRSFTHLHVHTDHSMLDGLGTVEDYVKRAKELGHPALAITDHGNVMGAPEFYWTCRDNDIEPILGEEFYFVPDAARVKEEKTGERFHVTILAKNREGFATLSELSTEAHARYYYKPVLERSLLEGLSPRDRKNLVVLSGCAGSIISRKCMGFEESVAEGEDPHKADGVSQMEYAIEEALWWKNLFPNFRMELMHHDTSFDRKLNMRLAKVGKAVGAPWVITNDPHYVMKDECDTHDALLAIQTASDVDDPDRFRFDGSGYHLRSRRELETAFSDYPRAIWERGRQETLDIARSCRIRIPSWDDRSWHIPKWGGSDEGTDALGELRRLTRRELRRRGLDDDQRYVSQAKHELREFKKVTVELEDHTVGMADFLLITRDAIEAAREKGIRVGPGRGSTCGSLVGYLIGLHKIDPIKYDLLFERFLNPERPKMPDVDTDFQASRRQEMFDWANEEYGAENVVPVAAFGTLQTKRAFQSLARAYGISDYGDRLRLSNEIVEDEDGNAVLPDEVKRNYPEIIAALEKITGVKGSLSSHAAGIIIFDPDDPVRDTVPMQWIPPRTGQPGRWVGQFNLAATEKLYLMKEDFLSLRALDTIEECLRMVKERHGVEIEPDDWVPDEEHGDKAIYRMLAKGDCHGVFQMEGGTNFQGIQQIKPTQFEDIVACTSLYRKGPMDAGADARFLENKKDEKIRVAHPLLRGLLGNSWGEMIYQEQMFEILHQLAGFSWSKVDDAKTAMTKKNLDMMQALRDEAVEGFQRVSGIEESVAIEIWMTIEKQAGYLFNRSHAVAYSMVTYQTAKLKKMYPLEYITALMRTVKPSSPRNKEKRQHYLNDAVKKGITIEPPDVNVSDAGFMPSGDDVLMFGLADIKGVGVKSIEKLIEARNQTKGKKFRKPEQVLEAVNNKGIFEKLCLAGALRSLGVDPDTAQQEELLSWQFQDRMADFRKKYAKNIVLPDSGRVTCSIPGEIAKVEKKTTKDGRPYRIWVIRHAPGEEYKITLWEDTDDLWNLEPGSVVIVKGKWNQQWKNIAVGDSENVKILSPVRKVRD